MKSKAILILTCLLLCPNAHAFEIKDLVGTWELVSYVLTEDGTEKPWCKSPFGIITYAAIRKIPFSQPCIRRLEVLRELQILVSPCRIFLALFFHFNF